MNLEAQRPPTGSALHVAHSEFAIASTSASLVENARASRSSIYLK